LTLIKTPVEQGAQHHVRVPGATYLFEEPATLDEVIAAAGQWFERHLQGDRT
jgi:hypothetical protein